MNIEPEAAWQRDSEKEIADTNQSPSSEPNDEPASKRRGQASDIEFAHIIEKINEGFMALDARMNYTYINQRGSELLKRKPQDLIGTNFWEEHPQDKDTSFGKAYLQALETQMPIEVEGYYAPLELWFNNRIYPSERGLSIFFNDITERKRLEDERNQLLQSERAQRAGAEQAQAAAQQELAERKLAEQALGMWVRNPLPHEARSLWMRYGVAAIATALALLLRLILQPVLGDLVPLVTLFGAVAFSVWYGGVGPGLLSVIAGYIGAEWFIIEPIYSISLYPAHALGLGLFLFSSLIIMGLGEERRRAQHHAHQSAQVAIARQDQLQLQLVEQKRIEDALRIANEKTEQSRDRIARLQQITAALTGSTTLSKLAEMVLEQGTLASRAAAGILVGVLDNGQEMQTIAALGYPSAAVRTEPVPLSAPTPMSDCIRTKRAVWIRSQAEFAEQYPSIAEFRRSLGNEATVALPLVVGDRVLGGLAFSFVEMQIFEEDEQNFFLAVAQRCAQALERARAEQALRISEERLRLATEAAQICAWEMDIQRQTYIVGENFAQAFGFAPDLLPSNSEDVFQRYTLPEDKQMIREAVVNAVKDGTDVRRLQYRILNPKNGQVIWLEVNAKLVYSRDGDPQRMFGMAQNITASKRLEEELRASEALYRAIARSIPNGGVYVLDKDLRYLVADGVVSGAFGLTRETLEGHTVSEIFGEEINKTMEARFQMAAAGETVGYETEHNGRTYWSQYAPLADSSGRTIMVTLDITERKSAEEELKRSEERERVRAAQMEAIMEAVPAAIWVAHDVEARLVTGNRASYEILRLPIGGNASLSAPEGVRPTNFQVLHQGQVMQPEELPVQRAARGQEAFSFEEEVRFEDGTSVHLFGNAVTLRDEQNNPSGAVAAFVDITKRKHAEEALRESEERFHAILKQATAGIVRKDAAGRLLFVNQAFCNMLGYTESDLLGKTIWQFTHANDVEENKRLYDRAMQEGNPFKLERRLIRADGSILWVDASVSPIMDATGKPQSAVTVDVDITARKQAEEALQQLNLELESRVGRRTAQLQEANQALEENRQRLQSLSKRLVEVQEEERRTLARELHDSVGQNLAALNLNLTIINNQLSNFVNEQVKARLSDSVNLILEVIALVRDLMSNLRPTVLDDYGLEAALQMTLDKFNARYGIGIRFDKKESLMPRLGSTLEMTLYRIAQEGLLNAVRHAQADQVALSLQREEQAIRLTIQDNGIGIQSLPEPNRPGSHGMKIMRERAEAVGGNLEILSTPGNGTQIEVSIPIQNDTTQEKYE